MAKRSFPAGIYAACLTWFSEGFGQEINYELQSKHLTHLIESGLTGGKASIEHNDPFIKHLPNVRTVVLAGSNGEAVALTGEERLELITLTRETATRLGRKDMPIVIGTVGQTTNEIITQLCASQKAGADFGLVLTPSYFHFAMDGAAIQEFFTRVGLLFLLQYSVDKHS
jgi:4-hydroxy-2-oxoglutarate aldolase